MRDYFKETLSNGLRVVTVEMPHLHSVETACYVGVGGRNETAELAGISHFLEHMLFRGTADHPSSLLLEQAFEAIGGAVNAATDTETTCFHSRLHPDRIGEGLALFAGMLRRPLFEELEIERRIVLEEALEDLNEHGEDINPDNLTARMLWPDSPLSLPTIGTRKTLERMDTAHLRHHHATFYTPANTVLVAAGRVRHEEVVAAAQRHFGDWARPTPPQTELWRPGDRSGKAETAWVKDSDSQVTLQLAFPAPGRRNGPVMALRLLRRILCWGATSRLMLRLRENLGLTYHVETPLSLFEECGCLSVDLAVAPANLTVAVQETLAVLADLSREPLGEEEMERVVRGYLYDLDFSRDHPEDLAMRYGWGELTGYLRTVEEDRREMAAVTAQALRNAARDVFFGGKPRTAVIGPYRKQDRAKVEKLLTEFPQGGT